MKTYVVLTMTTRGGYGTDPRYCGSDVNAAWEAAARLAAAIDRSQISISVWLFEDSEYKRSFEFEAGEILLAYINDRNLLEA